VRPAEAVQVRELSAQDGGALRAFLADVPADDRSFFKEDVSDPAIAAAWLEDTRSVRLVAVDDDGRMLAFAALSPGVARTSHVADLRVVVAARARGRGLARALTRRMLLAAVGRGVRKVTVDVAATQTTVVEMFRRLGFEPEALLRDHLCDGHGELQDLVVLSHLVDETWSAMLTAGLDDPR
jgi:ribosomal protein S18 acetylase RimI-like enzyme